MSGYGQQFGLVSVDRTCFARQGKCAHTGRNRSEWRAHGPRVKIVRRLAHRRCSFKLEPPGKPGAVHLAEAKVLIEAWRRHYNTVRHHSSLGYRPPAPETATRRISESRPAPPGRKDFVMSDRQGRVESALLPHFRDTVDSRKTCPTNGIAMRQKFQARTSSLTMKLWGSQSWTEERRSEVILTGLRIKDGISSSTFAARPGTGWSISRGAS